MTIRLFILEPEIVWTGRSDAPVITYPIVSIPYTDGAATGTLGPEQMLLVGSAPGLDDRGRQRIKAAPSGASGTLQIGRSSQGKAWGEVDLHDDDFLSIANLRQVFSKIAVIDPTTGEISKDGTITYSGQTGDDSPPVANAGAPVAATISGGVITVDFTAAASFATADGATISSYLWDVDDGTITAGTATSSTITATFPAGFRYCSLQVTDSNGNSHTCYVPVYARNPAADTTIQGFTIESHTITKHGQRVSFRILDDIPASTFLDGTLVLLFDGEPASASDRGNLLFYGFHHHDPAQIQGTRTGTLRDVVLECVDITGRLDMLPGFAVSLENKSNPAGWREIKNANMDKYLHFLLMWHSNALDLTDYTPSGTGADYPFVILGSDAASLFDQVNQRAVSLVPDHFLTCNTLGQLAVKVDPFLQDLIDRTSTVQTTLTAADYTEIRYTHQRPPRVNWLRGEAIIADSDVINTAFSVGPGLSPGQGETEQVSGEQLTKSQSDLQASEGHRYARLNAEDSYFSITLADSSTRGIEPANMTWVNLTLPAAVAAQRGLNFTAARGLVHEINIQYQSERTGLVKTVNLLWEKETDGIPAFPDIPPDMPTPPDYEPDPESFPEPETPTQGTGLGTAYVMIPTKLGRTRNLSASSPVWANITPTGPTALWDFILYSWAPSTTGFLATNDGVYKSTDLNLDTPTWSLVLSKATIESNMGGGSTYANGHKIISSINVEGYIALFHTNSATGDVYVSYSNNAGSTWSTVLISAGVVDRFRGGADYVPRLIGGNVVLWCLVMTGTRTGTLRKSTDGGATWSTAFGHTVGAFPNIFWSASLHCPYHDNAAGNVVFYTAVDLSSPNSFISYRTTNGTSQTQIATSGISTTARIPRRYVMETYTQDRQRVVFYEPEDSTTFYMRTSTNGGDSFTQQSATGISGVPFAVGGFPYLQGRSYAACTGGIFVTSDGGASYTDKTGNFTTAVGALSSVPSGVPGGVIVPLWTE